MTPDLVVAPMGEDVEVVELVDGMPSQRRLLSRAELAALVAGSDARLVWADTEALYPDLLARGVRVRGAVDLALQRALLRRASAVAATDYARGPASAFDELRQEAAWESGQPASARVEALFDVRPPGPDVAACVAEHRAQQACLAQAGDAGRLTLLCHAESTGGLLAAELNHVGVPFDTGVHDALLTELLGERDRHGGRPARMAALVAQVRAELGAPQLNPDSQPALVAALRAAGLPVETTRKWELQRHDHPAIAPLLEYKALSRLHAANGWAWAADWVSGGRFRPHWVPGAVVTGRWASNGGGALQLPGQVRAAIRADRGWRLVVADASQLEPRVLAAMAGDEAMAAVGPGDLYQALVDAGVVDTRAHAKVAMLGAMYGATTGEAGALMPRLRQAYPRAVALVDEAAAAGERGERVTTWLGRTSPGPSRRWRDAQAAASQPGAGAASKRRALQVGRDWGRFTRNFVVQGTAAEWALCWLGHLRRRLDDAYGARPDRPELVYFLHDEVMVHSPAELADDVAEHVRTAAASAGRLLFGAFPVEFPLQVAVVTSYADAK